MIFNIQPTRKVISRKNKGHQIKGEKSDPNDCSLGSRLEENKAEQSRKAETKKGKIPGSRQSIKSYISIYSRLKRENLR